MSGRSFVALSALGALLTLVHDAHAVDLTAMAGLGLGRWDYWSTDAHSSVTIPDWQLTANLSGQPFRPGLLDWQAGATYMGLRDYAPAQNSSRSAWGYRLSSALLSSSNVPVNLSASRTITSFATDIPAAGTGGSTTQTGTTETSVFNGSVVLRAQSYPTLRLSSSWVDSTNTPMGGPATTQDTRMINAGLAQSIGNHIYAVDYSSTWNTGNYALNNYRSDYMNAQFITTPRSDLMFRIREYYVLRTPTNDAALNPRYDDNMVSAGVLYRPGQRWSSNLDYDYRHSLVTAAGAPSTEQTSHGLTETTNFRYRPNLYFYGTGNVGYTDEQLQGVPVHASNQNLGGGANWQYTRGRTTLLSAGNGQLAALQMTDKPFTLGYALGGTEGVNHTRQRTSLSLSYNIAYSSNASGIGGSALVQSAYGSADALVGRSTQLRSTLSYARTRRTDPLLGNYNNYTASLLLRAVHRRAQAFYSADLTLGESEGVSASVGLPAGSPGSPVLSSAYNTRSRFATFQATQTMLRGKLSLVEVGRLMSLDMPQQPKQFEESVWVTLRYRMGAMYVTLEDRLSRGGTTGPTQTSNLLMLRLTRGFGGHF